MAQRVVRGIALLFHDHDTRRGELTTHASAALYPLERPGTHCTGGWVAPGPVWTGGTFHPHRDSIPGRSARSQFLYLLSYPAHWNSPEGSRKLRFPNFVTKAQDNGKVVSLTHRPPLPPGNAPGTHLC